MKNLIFMFAAILTLSCCSKDDDKPKTELDKLPPATQGGENKIGCLLDGKAFIPNKELNSTNCYYQFFNGGYYFHISFSKRDINNHQIGLALNTNSLSINEGQTLSLKDNVLGNATGYYYYRFNSTFTDQVNIGELKITNLDTQNHIVSGTFWYNILDYEGNLHKITDGRFDFQYTN
ncbi:hypothetical protein [Flavobacterium nackdongense]|uniref:Lipoprotein n=1 Tax=Flavobacterium nackdongense TaxID=2547394 RepID=A0A4P6YAL2_9FLAO|nr:hypothetical protein [Flavobacterium nackdongense]QBN20181.1 hypothetical protein E1750_15725 [Flavobacterium nackdongense]